MVAGSSEWIMKIMNFGFPFAITIYLFGKFEIKIENLELSINHLSEVVNESRRD